jgi:phosphate transport system substrate-binding protein
MQDFLTLYTTMWNPKGKLTQRGLIAAPRRGCATHGGAESVAQRSRSIRGTSSALR